MDATITPFRGGAGWWRSDRGSMTLEASMVFPWVLLTTFLLLLFSVWIMNRATVYYTVAAAGERAAFAWSHSSADIRSGAYPEGQYDSLYWRLKDDALLAGLFGWSEGGVTRVPIGAGEHEGEDALAETKLRKTAEATPIREGAVSYRNVLWKRELKVETADAAIPDPLLAWGGLGASRPISVSALVTEPAEWIRSFDLVRYYREKMQKKGDEAGDYRSKAGAVLVGRR